MTQTLYITPTRFVASAGKLDSDFRYIRRSSTPNYYFSKGKTMDVSGGGQKYVGPDGSSYSDGTYNGSFSGSGNIGVKV